MSFSLLMLFYDILLLMISLAKEWYGMTSLAWVLSLILGSIKIIIKILLMTKQ